MTRLAIFDIDGTLTDTNGVDDECYRSAVSETLGIPASSIDWTGAAHVTDSEIFQFLCGVHGQGLPPDSALARARTRFIDLLTTALASEPTRFAEVAGAAAAIAAIRGNGWCVALATGGWGPSARLKLRAARIALPDEVLACADDAASREDIVRIARRRAEDFYGRRFQHVVSIGDGVWDVTTAAALELPFIGIGSGDRAAALRTAGATVVLPNYEILNDVLDALDAAGHE
jgi:phosphoglycolate phosphatase-like HAD superfamily hydrolase